MRDTSRTKALRRSEEPLGRGIRRAEIGVLSAWRDASWTGLTGPRRLAGEELEVPEVQLDNFFPRFVGVGDCAAVHVRRARERLADVWHLPDQGIGA